MKGQLDNLHPGLVETLKELEAHMGTPSTIYRVRIKHSDQAGNVSANYSERVTFTTAAAGTVLPRQPVAYSQPRLPRN